MPKFVVYEIWTRSRVVTARNETDALEKAEPTVEEPTATGWSLSNWHAQEVKEPKKRAAIRGRKKNN